MKLKTYILLTEFTQSLRKLLRKPGYFALAVTTLGLGVAATATVFTLLHQAALRPLPYPQPGQLVTLGFKNGEGGNIAAPVIYQSLADNGDVADSTGLVSQYTSTVTLTKHDLPIVGTRLSADRGFLNTLQVRMEQGRNFNENEGRWNGPPAVILSHRYWQYHYDGDPAVVGKILQIEGKPVPVVGVLPKGFAWPSRFDVLTAMQIDPDNPGIATNEYIIARISDNIERASGRFGTLVREYLARHRSIIGEESYAYLDRQVYVAQPLKDLYTSSSGSVLWMFFSAAACVLLIAAINLTNLMVLRGIIGSHETAVRAALGAPWLRLAFPSLAEGALIGIAGCVAGLVLAWAGLRVLRGVVPPEWLRGADVEFAWPTAAFAFVVGVAVALLAALLGVLRGQKGNMLQELVAGGRMGWSRGAKLFGRVLVIAQTGIAVVLLVVAALFARSLYHLVSTPMGFESRSVTTFTLAPSETAYPDLASVEQQSQRIITRLSQVPQVQAVSVSTNLPTGSELNMPTVLSDGRMVTTEYRPATAGLLEVFSIPLVAGRWISTGDGSGAEPICVVSRAFADAYLGGKGIGATIKSPTDLQDGMRSLRVVGVVDDVRQYGPAQPPPPIVYLPLAQLPDDIWAAIRGVLPMNYAVRMRNETSILEGELRGMIAEVEPQQPISNVRSMQSVVASTTDTQRLNMLLIGLFALLSLLLAAVGLYAVISVATMARMHEFGVRAALGAPPRRLLKLVLREGLVQVGIGLLLGLAAALALSGVIQKFLFGVSPADPIVIAGVLVVLLGVGIFASLPPALRAARVNPIRVLRVD